MMSKVLTAATDKTHDPQHEPLPSEFDLWFEDFKTVCLNMRKTEWNEEAEKLTVYEPYTNPGVIKPFFIMGEQNQEFHDVIEPFQLEQTEVAGIPSPELETEPGRIQIIPGDHQDGGFERQLTVHGNQKSPMGGSWLELLALGPNT